MERDNRNGRLSLRFDEEIPTSSGFQLSDYENEIKSLKESEWRSRSMLNRDAEGWYKFSHKSILEYFLARISVDEGWKYLSKISLEGMDAARQFFEEILANEVLANEKGKFKLKNEKKYLPLSSIRQKHLKNLDSLSIDDLTTFSPIILANLTEFSLESIIVFDIVKYPRLYQIYFLYLAIRDIKQDLKNQEKHFFQEELERHKLFALVSRLRRQDLRRSFELLFHWEQSGGISILEFRLRLLEFEAEKELQKIKENKEQEKWPILLLRRIGGLSYQQLMQSMQEGFSKIQEGYRIAKEPENLHSTLKELEYKLGELFENNDALFLSELKAANNFILECQELEKTLPNIKIYY